MADLRAMKALWIRRSGPRPTTHRALTHTMSKVHFARWTAEVSLSRLRRYRAWRTIVQMIQQKPGADQKLQYRLAGRLQIWLAGDLDGALEICKRRTSGKWKRRHGSMLLSIDVDYNTALELAAARLPDSLGHIDTDLDYPPLAEELDLPCTRRKGESGDYRAQLARGARTEFGPVPHTTNGQSHSVLASSDARSRAQRTSHRCRDARSQRCVPSPGTQ